MKDIVKILLIPGSTWFVLLGLTAGVLALYSSAAVARWGRRWLVALSLSYWLMSVPALAELMSTPPTAPRAIAAASMPDAPVIVVLGSGVATYATDDYRVTVPGEQTALNAFEAARIYHLRPRTIIVSGGIVNSTVQRQTEGELLRDLLVRCDVPASDIVIEATSQTTAEQAVNVREMLKSSGFMRVMLITSPVHMLRAAGVFRSQGIDVIPVVSRYESIPGKPQSRWLPGDRAMRASRNAIYDYLGWLYYWGNGSFQTRDSR